MVCAFCVSLAQQLAQQIVAIQPLKNFVVCIALQFHIEQKITRKIVDAHAAHAR